MDSLTDRPPPRPPKRPPPPTMERPPMKTRVPPAVLGIMAVSVLGLSAYGSFLYTSYRRAAGRHYAVGADVSDRYRDTAGAYDGTVELAERMLWMGSKRRALVRQARGDVLELSAGTGRNLPFYLLGERRSTDQDGRAAVLGCRSLTVTDLCGEMLAIARWKWEQLGVNGEKGRAPVVFREMDAQGPADGRRYDTVVQTMGLCSVAHPELLLQNLSRLLKEDGRILLLEHGRGFYGWTNALLDGLAAAHADRHGCWWNRDVGALVEASGLQVVSARRYHLGTTYEYVLRLRDEKGTECEGE